MIARRIKELSKEYYNEVRDVRRHLHANPELSFEEHKTSGYIRSFLEKLNLEFVNMADTGLVAIIKGEKGGDKTVAMRADIDALPIMENNNVSYRSQNPGVMHACGHDVHTASLIGAIKILNEIKSELKGTIKILFQPGEEKLPGGASIMIREGALENPRPNSIFGQHVMPELKSGTVGFRPGKFMASTDEIYITVHGKGGHAAMPYKNIDPILTASHMIVALQQVVSRNANPNIPTVLSIGHIEGIGETNIIPDKVFLKGTFRTFDEDWRYQAHEKIRNICQMICESMGAKCDVDIQKGYPSLDNDVDLTERAIVNARNYMGEENVISLDRRPTAEDFSYYSQEIPACFYRLGISNVEKGITAGLHTPNFDIDENSLITGMGLFAYLTLMELNGED